MECLIEQKGLDCQTAVNQIKSVYGNVAINTIINKLKKDEENGGHARLK